MICVFLIYTYRYIPYIYNTGPEENHFFQPHLDDAHSKLVHRSNYLHFGTTKTSNLQSNDPRMTPPAFTKRKSRNNLMSRSSLNNLRECFQDASRWIVCLSTLESVSPSLSTLLNAISALALCQNMLENISHLNQDHQRTEIHYFESWIPSPWNVKHATRLIVHEYFVQRQPYSECRWTKTSDRSGNLKAIKQSPSGHDLQLENVSKCGRCPAFPIWTCQQHEYPTARGKTHPSASMHSQPRKWLVSIDPPRWKWWLLR